MNLADLTNLSLRRVGVQTSPLLELIVKNAINNSYLNDFCKLDKRITTAYIPVINTVISLPEDLEQIEKTTPELLATDQLVGDSIITGLTDSMVTVVYSVAREALVNDTDEPDLLAKYHYHLTTYAAYELAKNIGNINMANFLMQEYTNFIENEKHKRRTNINTKVEMWWGDLIE